MGRPKGSGKYDKILKVRISEEMIDRILIYSEVHKISVSEIVRRALNEQLKRGKSKNETRKKA